MRDNCRRVYASWREGKEYLDRGRSIWTNGRVIYSYNTALVTRTDDDRVVLNRTRYSQTTTVHQNALYAALMQDDSDVVLLTGEPIGVSGVDLAAHAGAAAL